MSFVSGLLGTAGGAAGTGFGNPTSGNILNPASSDMGTQALQNQANLVNAYQPGGTAALASQQQLLGQLGQEAQGQGPNPALNQLAQATGANTANQAALMASQRGTGQNAGLIARQAAQQGAQNQQQAAGQAATLSAQQQLANQQQLAAQQAQLVGQQQTGQQQYTGNVLGQIQSQNNAQVGMQSNINQANAGLAEGQMKGQQNLLGNAVGGIGSAMGLAQGGQVGAAPNLYNLFMNEGGQIPQSMPAMAGGPGSVPMADGGALQPAQGINTIPPPQPAAAGPQSTLGRFIKGAMPTQQVPGQPAPLEGMSQAGNTIGKGIGTGIKSLFGSTPAPQANGYQPVSDIDAPAAPGMPQATTPAFADVVSSPEYEQATSDLSYARGGKVPALVSPGEQYIPPEDVKKVKAGKNPLKTGERIPGKPKYKGNDYRNDTVKKTLKEGGVVIPNNIMQGPNPAWNAMRFVHAHTRSLTKKSK